MFSISIDEMASFCKKKGFIYPNSEIYGGLSGFWDYGHLGVELKNNIKSEWWKAHVHEREDIVGIDGSIISHNKVWQASGHVSHFTDLLLSCPKCKNRFRADHFIEDATGQLPESLTPESVNHLVKSHNLKCPNCKVPFEDVKAFNLMFKTNIGPVESDNSLAYLRPETAQMMFTNFKLVQEHARLKLPFGIAQMGRAFRNEISPRDFLFRCREFEQMEIEYFIDPEKTNECRYIDEFMDYELNIYSAEMEAEKKPVKKMSIREALDKKIIRSRWHGYWLAFEHNWFVSLGVNPAHLRLRQHMPDEKSHYAIDTWDLEFEFPFGWKELEGISNRSDFDLKQHIDTSGKDLTYFDEEKKKRFIPHVVAEPSLGVERTFLVFMFDAYHDDKKRGNIVLKLHPKLAPYKAAIFPLLSNKEELTNKAKGIYDKLKKNFNVFYDQSGSIGRRYARQDETGTPYCITVDFESLNNDDVTIRDRDTTNQVRVKIDNLQNILSKLMNKEIKFSDIK